ncbi:MAG: hypothetical protein D6723_18835 [Acidobacteria bacterium]|nr:MAG: hypothetical protein D6723_18835 [Acidobacteriota bacterium]
MVGQDEYDRTMSRALKLLSTKSRTVAELREQLREKTQASEAIIERVIARLQEWGYLDDARFAADYGASRLRLKPLGRRRLARELAERKVPEAIITTTLDRLYEDVSEETLIDRAIQKRLRTRGRPRTRQHAKKLFDHLIRLGFDHELVRRKIDELARSSADEE